MPVVCTAKVCKDVEKSNGYTSGGSKTTAAAWSHAKHVKHLTA
jgi:hypothetical protein